MRICFLGPLSAFEGDRVIPLGGPRQRLVLAHLVIRANQVVPAERLIDEVWGDGPPESARATLQSYVSHLRRALGTGRIESHGQGYVLRVDREQIDGLRFEGLAGEGRRLLADDPAAAATVLQEALGLWQGAAFADLTGEPSLRTEIVRLEELRISAVEDRVAAELAQGGHGRLVGELETLTAAYPLRERLWGQLVLALYRSARQAEALAAFERARRLLAEELGIDPSPELRRLHEQILRQDPTLQPGVSALRGYRLLERVGEGAFGVVWRAVQPGVEREVAIKAIHPRLANRPEFVRGFEAEAQLVVRVEHPHAVPLYDFWREPDGAYLVMRFLRGGSLRALLDRSGPPEPGTAARIIEQVARALAAAHRQGVVHRDVKPSNVLLDEDGNAYLSDFGIARQTAGSTRETPPYTSPERLRGEPLAPAADVYSMGILISRLLAAPADPMRKVIERATAADPAQRYRDAAALLAAVRTAWPQAAQAMVPGPASSPRKSSPRNPYKGLLAFTEADACDFFGREALIARLLTRLREHRFLAVVGPSGSGKSSVVRAGLIPALRAGALPGSGSWFVVRMVPGTDPWEELETALLAVAVGPPSSPAALLESGQAGLARLLPDGEGELLLVIDQFEEIFTLVQDEDRRRRFLAALVSAVADPRSRLRVVVTLRADFYDRPLQYGGLAELVRSRTEVVVPLSAEELQQAVTRPAEAVGVKVAPGLVAQMVADVADQPGALPLVQYALTELFDRRQDAMLTPSAYRQIGGISGALARRADQIFLALPDGVREAARQLYLRLVTIGEGTGGTRRRVPRAELVCLQPGPQEMEAAIDAFGAARLLSFDRDPDTRAPTVEVAHEALLREWTRLRGWIDAAREHVRTERRLAAAARDWLGAGRDDSFLVTGSRLDQWEAWRNTSGLALTPDQHDFLRASAAERDRARAQEEHRRARERALERRSVRRLRGLVAVLATAAITAAGLTVFATGQRERAEAEARRAAARELAAAAVGNPEADPERSILLALHAVRRTRSADGTVLPEAEEALHRAVGASRVVLTVLGVGGALDWSPDGSIFTTEGPEETGMVDIRDARTGRSVRRFRGHDVDVNEVAFSPGGALLATTGDDGSARVWNVRTGTQAAGFTSRSLPGGEVWAPSFSPDVALLAAAWKDEGLVRVLDAATGRVKREFRTAGKPTVTRFSPDGGRLAILARDPNEAAVVDVASRKRLFTLRGVTSLLTDVEWSPDGRWIATTGIDANARVWEATTGKLRFTLQGHTSAVVSADWSPDSTRLITGGEDGTARLWEPGEAGWRQVLSLSGAQDAIAGVAFSPDGRRVMTGDAQIGSVKVWDVSLTGDAEWLNVPGGPAANAVAFTPDGGRLAAIGGGGSVTVWDAATGRAVRVLGPGRTAPASTVPAIDVSPDGALIATATGEVTVWHAASGRQMFTLAGAVDVDWSPDGGALATATKAGGVSVVDRSGRLMAVFPGDPGLTTDRVRFSPDGRLLAYNQFSTERFNAGEPQVKIWDWKRRKLLRTLRVLAYSIGFDPAGSRIVLGEPTGRVDVWDVGGGRNLLTLAGHTGVIGDAVFSPDGTRIATAGADSTIRLWDATSGEQVLTLRGHKGMVFSLRFSPDGGRLTSGGDGDAIRVWALNLDDLIRIARANLTRALTDQECRQYLHTVRCPPT
ncbi:protein kinase [Actinomadura sp. ATCC 31491]|uniref:Protein kinase n=1 Tax=Actinomadura luzonensis TaxID=2805427 RepID=A0ABT0G782_9ACTN|nr:BTAD domain-containing putative transcriptional regulator [Actinomadura luzonensis]MCK2220447.1 protein kinase [Actinomadura luzonensis]